MEIEENENVENNKIDENDSVLSQDDHMVKRRKYTPRTRRKTKNKVFIPAHIRKVGRKRIKVKFHQFFSFFVLKLQ